MTMLVAYEVQVYESGNWQIASMFNEKELALMEARRIEEGIRRRETRVVEESHDEDSGRTRSKVVYTTPQLRTDQPQAAAKAPQAPAANKNPAPRGAQAERTPGRRPRPAPQQSGPNMTMIVLTFFLIVCLGVVGIVGLRYLSGLG